jgi:hypothetical protein
MVTREEIEQMLASHPHACWRVLASAICYGTLPSDLQAVLDGARPLCGFGLDCEEGECPYAETKEGNQS